MMYMKRFFRLLGLFLASTMLCTACSPGATPDSDPAGDPAASGAAGNLIPSDTFPMFSNDIDYSRGGNIPESEAYLNYSAQKGFRHTFTDMVYHDAELAAVRLAEAGIFEKTDTFAPDEAMNVQTFVTALLQLAGKAKGGEDEAEVKKLVKSTALAEDGVLGDYGAALTREQLAYLLDRACVDRENVSQYKLLVGDFAAIADSMKNSVLQCIGLGLLPCSESFSPQQAVTRAEAAQALYRLANPGMRLIPPYELGDAYADGTTTYLVKNTYEENPGGVQFGFWSNYNQQAFTFSQFGKRPIDRVDFHKWVSSETEKGHYQFGFSNSQNGHKLGSTVITNVDISANLEWNPYFQKSNIPAFYKQDITDPETRQAAKSFLYSYVQALLEALKGDVILSIDYEVDWQQNISGIDEESRRRAAIWGEWYVEACQVARDAAKQIGAADRLKLIIIYNNITDLHKLGVAQNEWMVKCGQASDYIGIDSYAMAQDKTDPSITLESMRYLINNFSFGKPVIMVENGLSTTEEGISEQTQADYFKNLFREFRFALGKGDFLNGNLAGYLVWCLKDEGGAGFGLFREDGSAKPAAAVVREGIDWLESCRQYNPSVLKKTENVISFSEIEVSVNSGTAYDKLTFVTEQTAGEKNLRIKLREQGSVYITVNGTYHYASTGMTTRHVIALPEGVKDGINVIDIYFGHDTTPFSQAVEAIDLK